MSSDYETFLQFASKVSGNPPNPKTFRWVNSIDRLIKALVASTKEDEPFTKYIINYQLEKIERCLRELEDLYEQL